MPGMLHVKSCNIVKRNSESVFCYFASAVNSNYNRRQNELRHFALNGLFDIFRTSKGVSSAIPSLNGGDRGGVWILMFQKLPYLSTMCQQFCRGLSESKKWPHILKKINSTHVFVLGCKTPVGFLFAMFNVVMPIWEQLECGDFVIFSAWLFVSRLSCLDIVWCGASHMIFYSLLYWNKVQSE